MFPLGAKTTLRGAIAEITGIDMGILAGMSIPESMSTAKRMKPLGFL